MDEKKLSYGDFIIKENIDASIVKVISENIHPVFAKIFHANLRFKLKTIDDKCIFLSDKGCTLSDHAKPHYCKLYPFWLTKDSDYVQVLLSEKCLAQTKAHNISDLLKLIGTDRDEIFTIFKNLENDLIVHLEDIANYADKIPVTDFEFKAMQPEQKEYVSNMVKDIWDGDDYLPMVFDKWVADKKGRFIGAYHQNQLVGLAKLSFYADGYAWLEGLRADPRLKIRGIASAFNKYMISLIKTLPDIKAVEFNTYYANFASIHCAEKNGFIKKAVYSYKVFDLNDCKELIVLKPNLLAQIDTDEILNYIKNSAYLQENRLCSGWEAYPVLPEIIEEKFLQNRQYLCLKKENKLEALLLYETDSLQNTVHLCFLDSSDKLKAEILLKNFINLMKEKGFKEIDLACPSDFIYFELFKDLGFYSFEKENDYLLFRHKDY